VWLHQYRELGKRSVCHLYSAQFDAIAHQRDDGGRSSASYEQVLNPFEFALTVSTRAIGTGAGRLRMAAANKNKFGNKRAGVRLIELHGVSFRPEYSWGNCGGNWREVMYIYLYYQ
jgi:hypothetical protein